MIEIRLSNVDEMLANAGELFSEHWEEVALNKQVMVLKPDEQRYRAVETQGMSLIIGAFEDGKIVGYSVNIVTTHSHYADLVICNNDLLFVTESKRSGRLGVRLIKETERLAKERGVQLMLWHAKPNTALERIMPRLGYGIQDIIFSIQI
jgi:predicted GNAT superfamily acetyltransferase